MSSRLCATKVRAEKAASPVGTADTLSSFAEQECYLSSRMSKTQTEIERELAVK